MTHTTAHIADTAIFTEHQPVFVTLEDALDYTREVYERLAAQAISECERKTFSTLSGIAKELRAISYTNGEPAGLKEVAENGAGLGIGFIESARSLYHCHSTVSAHGFAAATDIIEHKRRADFNAKLAVIVLEEAEDLLVKPLVGYGMTI